jgi:hypothetical protein
MGHRASPSMIADVEAGAAHVDGDGVAGLLLFELG